MRYHFMGNSPNWHRHSQSQSHCHRIHNNKYTHLVTTTSEYAFDEIFMHFFQRFFVGFCCCCCRCRWRCCVHFVRHSMVAKEVQSAEATRMIPSTNQKIFLPLQMITLNA